MVGNLKKPVSIFVPIAVVTVFAFLFLFGWTVGTDPSLKSVKIDASETSVDGGFEAIGIIPKYGENGALGYGIITDKGTDALIVMTTHSGVLDSESQEDKDDPVWHTHFVRLGEVYECGDDPGVVDITFESPGEISVGGKMLSIKNVPGTVFGTHSIKNVPIVLEPGTNVEKVVQFGLYPKMEGGSVVAVCVIDIETVDFVLGGV